MIHAASVGEVQAAAPLVRALLKRYPEIPLVLTTMTPTGSERVRELFGETVEHSYVPFDLVGAVRRFIGRARPELVVILETELWPNLFHQCRQSDIPILIASARVSARSADRYRRLTGLFRETLSSGVVIAAQTEIDVDRFVTLGANPDYTSKAGNIKFDFELPPDLTAQGHAFRRDHAPDRPVWIAASTHGEEDELVVAAHRKVITDCPDAILILVPRHPERFPVAKSMLERTGLTFVTRSSGTRCRSDTQVFLGDSLGELTLFYAAADVAFVGGSLVPVGGHNLLEAAALGLPILTGPHNFNAPDIAVLLQDSGSTKIVGSAHELADSVIKLLADESERQLRGKAGRDVVTHNRGTLRRLLEIVASLVAEKSG